MNFKFYLNLGQGPNYVCPYLLLDTSSDLFCAYYNSESDIHWTNNNQDNLDKFPYMIKLLEYDE